MAQFEGVDFPGWEVVRKIGEGSFGGVYEIHRTLPGGRVEKCALKKLAVPRNDGEIQELISQSFSTESITAHYKNQMGELVNEYSLTQELSSCKNVVGCYDVRFIQHDDGIGWDIYIRMELLNPLRQALSAEYQEATVLRLGLDMCNALLACQEHSIIHQDIKPENILVSDRGEFKLGDFGIAKVSERTGTGTMTGTMGYMAPEVANRQHYGPQADIYSLGMVLYWMMNRRTLPFLPYPPAIPSAIQRQEAANRRLAGEAFPPPAHGSAELKAIVMKACAYSPAERCQSVQELQQTLSACADRSLARPQDPDATISDTKIPDEPTQYSTVRTARSTPVKAELPRPAAPSKEERTKKENPAPKKKLPRKWLLPIACILLLCGGVFGIKRAINASSAALLDRAANTADGTKKTVAATEKVTEAPTEPPTTQPETERPTEAPTEAPTVGAAPGVLMSDGRYSEDEAVFEQEVLRKEIATITFLPALDNAPADAWDLSEAEDGSVLGWVTGAKGNYDLYIAADGSVIAPRRSGYLFACYTGLKEINFNGCFDTSSVATMSGMFAGCQNLQSLNLSGFDTSQVADMSFMFSHCENLQSLDLSSFNTSQVVNMQEMFSGSRALTSIDVSNFDTSDVIDMGSMFAECESLTNVEVSNFNTSNVIRMRAVFDNCKNLMAIDVSSFNTSRVIDMAFMFSGCESLESLNLSGFDTSRVTDMAWMFGFCRNLKSIDLSSFDTSHVTDMDLMFDQCDDLVDLDLENFDFTNVTRFRCFMSDGKRYNGQPWRALFKKEVSRQRVLRDDMAWEEGAAVFGKDVLRSEVTAVTFLDSLEEAPTDAWDLSVEGDKSVLGWVTGVPGDYHFFIAANGVVVAPQYCSYLFFGYTNLRKIEFNNCFDTSDVYSMDSMFDGCTSLTSLDLSSFNTEKVMGMFRMFYNCHSLTELNLTSFRAPRADRTSAMFAGCSSLTKLDLSSFNTPYVTCMDYMFSGCKSLNLLNLSGLDTSYVMSMAGMFESCGSLADVDLSNFDFARVIYYDNFMDEGRTYNGKPWEALFS